MGKRTTTRHKEENTFRFETFEEKLKNISVNVNLSIRDGRNDLMDEEATFFFQEIEKWIDLNRTETFGQLLTEIGYDIKSLPQVLLQKDRLSQVLLNHLQNKDNVASYEPTFALVVALSRDLGPEFYSFFQEFFKIIIDIVIASKDSEIIEQGFKCYAYLTKYLRRQIIRDIQQHLKLFAPLLHPKLKKYVVIFACEAFAVVASKYTRDHPDNFLDLVFKILLRPCQENTIGVSNLLFAMFKGVGGSLKIGGPGFKLVACVNYLFKLSESDRSIWMEMLKALMNKLINHANSTENNKLFETFENLLVDLAGREQAPDILLLYKSMIEHENCNKLPDVNKCVNILRIVSNSVLHHPRMIDELSELVMKLIEVKGKSTNPEILTSLKPTVVRLLEITDLNGVKKIDSVLQDTSHYFHTFMLSVIKAYERVEQDDQREINPLDLENKAIRCISEAVVRHNGFYHLLKKSDHFFTGFGTSMWFYENQKRIIRPLNLAGLISKPEFDCCEMIPNAEKSLSSAYKQENLARLFLSYSRMSVNQCTNCLNASRRIANLVIGLHEVCEDVHKRMFSMILFFILETLIMHTPLESPINLFEDVDITKYLKSVQSVIVDCSNAKNPVCLWDLKCLDLLVHYAKLDPNQSFGQEIIAFVNSSCEGLTSNLQSGFKIIRSLTLSILRNILHVEDQVKPGGNEKLIEMYDKFIEIEDMSVMDPKFSSMAKSALIECKVLMESKGASEAVKKLCLKYTLGLMYSNFNLIWPVCISVIQLAGNNLEFSTFWNIFGNHFKMHFPESSCGTPRIQLVLNGDTSDNDFLTKLDELTFGFPSQLSGSIGLQEVLDISQYRVNLWKSVIGVPIEKPEYQEIKYIIDKSITNSFEEIATERGLAGEIQRTLIPMFQFLEKCELASADLNLWEKSLNHLIGTPEIQKAVWDFLHAKRRNKLKAFKDDVDELIKSDSMDVYHKFRIDAIDTTINKLYQNESAEKRGLLMDIVIRILIGKEKRWKAEKRLQALRFIGGCTDSDARKYLELAVGPGLKNLRISPKIIEIKINKISNSIRVWRYKFPTILDELLNLVCDLTLAISNLKKPFPKHSDEDELPQEVFEEQKKGALKSGRLCVVAFFTHLSNFNLDETMIERIFDTFIWTGIDELRSHTGTHASWIMKLFLVWSSHERFHVFFTKCRDDVKTSPMQAIFDLLETPTTSFEVRKYLLGILLNLIVPPDVEDRLVEEENQNQPLEHSEKFDGRPLTCRQVYTFNNAESVGLNVVLYGKEVVLKLFEDVHLFNRFVNQPGGDRCLGLISRLAEFVDNDDRDSIRKLCLIVIETFSMYKHNEENLYHCLVACKNFLVNVPEPRPLLLKLAVPFTWISGRRLRSALCEILSSQKDDFLYQAIRDLNAWADLAIDTPDFSKRQDAFRKLENAITEGPFDRVLFTLTAANCFNGLLHETDIGMRNSSKNLLIVMSAALNMKSFNDDEKELHLFLESMIIPRLRGGIQHKDENRYSDFLQVYIAFIQNCTELHGTFKELDKVLSSEIVEGLYDIQIHLRTRAMNKLCKRISEVGKDVSPVILKNFVLPIANHNLLDEEKIGKNSNELIDSSIEVMKIIMQLMPHEHYFKYLMTMVDNPKKNTKLAKQYERILVAAMDAFHFDLSLAVGTESKEKPKPEKEIGKDPTKTEIQMEVEEVVETVSDNDDMSTNEELEPTPVVDTPQFLEITLVPKSAAVRCLNLLKTIIIPKLREYLNFEEKATHKLSRAEKKIDDDVILKIPCTLALVKLLKKIPKSEGENSIRSIIPCLCAGLRNELFSARNSLRKTLLNVIKELGISQFKSVLSYLKSTLQRGYQKHVLNYTVGYLMKCLEPELKKDPDQLSIKDILPLCEDELYGVMQEEKELAKIKAKTREAGRNNAHPILKLCAKCIRNKSSLASLIEPAVKHLSNKRSPKVAKTTRQWLNSVGEGLADNLAINHLELIAWLKEVLQKEFLNEEPVHSSQNQPEKKKKKLLVESKDAFIISESKKKSTADGKITGQFLLTEFAFTCLYNGLNKNNRLKDSLRSMGSIQELDDFVPRLGDGIKSSSKQVNIISLRCLTLLFEFELLSFRNSELIDGLRRSGFIAMNNHCYRTSSDTQMTNATFKFLTAFFMRFPDYKIVVQDFELMLKCIQSYLTSGECSSAAITLLKGVLKNKFKSANLQDLMEEIFSQSIQSFYQHINEGCRQAYVIYLNNYCTTPKELSSHVKLILNQFDYSTENGRITAVEIMNSLLSSMPEKCLEEIKELVFLKSFATLDKESQPSIRGKLCDVMKTLFQNESKKSLVRLFLKLLNSNKHVPELDTFFLIAGTLIDTPNIFTGTDFAQLLNKIKEVLNPEAFEEMCSEVESMSQQAQDYSIYQALVCLKKGLLRNINGSTLWSTKCQLSDTMKSIFGYLQKTHLLYEHEWVPVITVEIFSILFAKLCLIEEDVKDKLAMDLENGHSVENTVLTDMDDLKTLLKNVWTIMKLSEREDLLMKGTVILVQLASVAARLSDLTIFEDTITEIRRSINHEVVKDPKNTTTRLIAFAIFRGIAKNSPIDAIRTVSEGLTRVAVRELTDEGVSAAVKLEAEKLTTILRTALGNADFNNLYAKINDFYHKKRNLNRAKKKETFVLHPGKVRKRPHKPTNSKVPFKKAKNKS